jgi:energy-coupling factor transporter ATP-binding protein EcfA2
MPMKIKSFVGRRVHGYLNIGFDLRSDLTILFGPNGCGKTSAIRLIEALLTPALTELLSIDYEYVEVAVESGGSNHLISSRRQNGGVTLSCTGTKDIIEVPQSLAAVIGGDDPSSKEAHRELTIRYSERDVWKRISALGAPVFLGLERRHVPSTSDATANWSFLWASDRENPRRTTRRQQGTLGTSLFEMQALVQEAYRRIRRVADERSSRLRNKLLLAGFRYRHFAGSVNDAGELNLETEFATPQRLREQQNWLVQALVSIGVPQEEAERELAPYFDQVIALGQRMSAENSDIGAFFEALVNKANLDRLEEIVTLVKDYTSSAEQLMDRFRGFSTAVNAFFADSSKQIEVDPVGLIRVQNPNMAYIGPESLSSGERQLLIMFGHLYFNSFGARSSVFVVDEPELSLHLKWQGQLVDAMRASNPRAQLILATHSPEIVGDHISACVEI